MEAKKYTLKDFLPLIVLFALVISFVVARQIVLTEGDNMQAMRDFMAAFFLLFGMMKLLNWKGFVEAYRMYDIVAKHSVLYAYLYPLVEIGLGLSYLLNILPLITNVVTLVIMLVGSIGVAKKLMKKETIACACMGVVFKVPMTWVTLVEDLLMAVMAAVMIFSLI